LRGPAKLLAWLALLACVSFVAVFCFGSFTDRKTTIAEVVLVTCAMGAGLLCVRWLRCWRNFRRALFVVVCLITLIALAYAEENWRGKHAWQSYRRAWEAKGERFDVTAVAPPRVPDEKNFAFTPLLKPAFDFARGPTGLVWHDTNGLARLERISADLSSGSDRNSHLARGSLEKGTFADLKAYVGFYRGNTNYPQAGASATPAETILVALGKFDPELKELREAAASRPACRFPIHYEEEPPGGILLPHLARIKGLTTLTHVRATAELEAGRSAEAFEDLKLGLRFSDSITNEPLLIDHLVRLASLAIDLQTLREGLVRHALTETQLAELESYLSTLSLLAEYQFAMRGERAFGTAGLDFVRRQGFRADPMDFIGDENGASASTPPLNAMPGGWYYQNMLTLSRLHQDFSLPAVDAQAHRVFPEVYENGRLAVGKTPNGPFNLLAKMIFAAGEKAVVKSARMQAYVDLACVACALERCRLANGKLPDALDALAPRFIATVPNDIIDGKPLRYRTSPGGGYRLYSVGWNQTDDGGETGWSKKLSSGRDENEPAVDATKGDWVWGMTD